MKTYVSSCILSFSFSPFAHLILLLCRGDDDDVGECGEPYKEHPKNEHICGRPLGLCFNVASGQLYVADAYMGLVVIEPNGGIARKVISHALEGQPLAFTNSLDIDQRTGAVYFTSSSSRYERR